MKKLFFLLVLLMVPFLVNAASLVTGITVDGIGDLKMDRNTWNLSLTTTLDYVDIDVTYLDGVTIEGAGKVDVQEGDNEIIIKASNGTTTEEYKVNIKIARPTYDSDGNPETGAFIPSVLIVGGVLAVGILFLVSKNKLYKI